MPARHLRDNIPPRVVRVALRNADATRNFKGSITVTQRHPRALGQLLRNVDATKSVTGGVRVRVMPPEARQVPFMLRWCRPLQSGWHFGDAMPPLTVGVTSDGLLWTLRPQFLTRLGTLES